MSQEQNKVIANESFIALPQGRFKAIRETTCTRSAFSDGEKGACPHLRGGGFPSCFGTERRDRLSINWVRA